MIRVTFVAVLACGCLDNHAAPPPTCDPVATLDVTSSTIDHHVDVAHDGTSVCLRIDTASITRPHVEIAGPATFQTSSSDFDLDLRNAANLEIAPGADVMIGTGVLQIIDWDPAGGEVYDVLVNIKARDPAVFDASAIVDVQLSPE